jgi:hypothetical protein
MMVPAAISSMRSSLETTLRERGCQRYDQVFVTGRSWRDGDKGRGFDRRFGVEVATMTAATIDASTNLRDLLRSRAPREAITGFLDSLPARERVEEALSLRNKEVGQLYQAVVGGPASTIEDFLPGDVPDDTTIIFEGRNSLPAFSRFQKRFARLDSSDAGGQVVGYNHQTMAFATGPGFFVVKAGSLTADVANEAYFDYTDAPESVPTGWPDFKPNDRGLSNLVYRGMKDYMRKAATNVFVGEAYKGGRSQRQFFILTRTGD